MWTLVATFASLGVPLEPFKLEGPASCLTFLGIELDTVTLQLRLPNDKLLRLKEALATAESKKCMSKQNLQSLTGLLQSLTGLLQHAVKVVRCFRVLGLRGLHRERLVSIQVAGTPPRPVYCVKIAHSSSDLSSHLRKTMVRENSELHG